MKQLISKSFYTVFVITMFIFTAGVCVGGGIAGILPPSLSETAVSAVTASVNPDRLDAFATSFINFFKPIFVIWIFGFFKYTFAGICITTAYRGGIVGYYIGTLVKAKGAISALVTSSSSLLPHYLLFIPMLAGGAYFALKNKANKAKHVKNPPYFVYLALLASGCAIAALCDAYVSVWLIKITQGL